MGRLEVGPQTIDFREMAERRLRFPPIMFLAACDTYSSDRKGPTVAHALLAGGAATVVATLGPVGAVESAVLAAELLGHVLHFVPGLPGQIRWSELFWMSASTAYVAQATIELRRRQLLSISPAQVEEVVGTARRHLTSFDPHWLLRVWEHLSAIGKRPLADVEGWWTRHAYLTDSVLHSQLGHADMVFLAPSANWKGVEHSGVRGSARRRR